MNGKRFGLGVLCALAATIGLASSAGAKTVIGYVERVALPAADLVLLAKMDTGARHSSLSAREITEIQRDGAVWVRFVVEHSEGELTVIEAPLLRVARIRRHGGESQSRIVVTMPVCLGSTIKETQVNLVDRAGFNYPILIGRSFLSHDFIVDSSIQKTLKLDCLNGR